MQSFTKITVLLMLIFAFSFADVINVPADQPTIQAGINAAVNGDTVLVADGTYIENINFLGKAITVASHYLVDADTSHISATVIDGSQPSNPDSGSVVYFIAGEDTNSVLSGFTITGGSGTMTEFTNQGVVYPIRAGGGILCYESGARITANVIMNNNVPVFDLSCGGGVGVLADSSGAHVRIDSNKIISNSINSGYLNWGSGVELYGNGTITNNNISSNSSDAIAQAHGAIHCWADLTPGFVLIKDNHITHNEVNGNEAFAGGITIDPGIDASVIDNDVSDNVLNGTNGIGGGIYVRRTTGAILIDGNKLTNNMINNSNDAWGGGISLWADDPATNTNILITNNLVSGNQAKEGAGIYSRRSKANIINNTIVNNTATIQGGAILVRDSAIATVMNSILWGNNALNGSQIYLAGGVANVAYSDVQGGWSGDGNIDADTQFEDTSAFYLAGGSPCIDAGNPGENFSDPEDPANPGFALWPAMGGVRNDMGAYGGPGAGVLIDPILAISPPAADMPPAGFQLYQNYPNPFNPSTTIEFALAKGGWVTLKVYNILGEVVAELVAENLSAGSYKYDWNAAGLASGVYFYRLEAGRSKQTRKLVLLK